jgi:hypothetical protein
MILRMNGEGQLALSARHDDGTSIDPTRVDSGHIASSYDTIFPGTNEWGILFTFPKEGCWHVRAERSTGAADFYLIVIAT